MNYNIVLFPDKLAIDRSLYSIQDVDDYFNWFLKVKSTRIEYFKNKLNLDGRIESDLKKIEDFLHNHIQIARKTKEEMDQERMTLPEAIRSIHSIKDYKFISPSYSIFFDVGLTLGEMLIFKFDDAEWKPCSKKKMVDYGLPIVQRKGRTFYISPFWNIEVIALRMTESQEFQNAISNPFNSWLKSLTNAK